MTQLSAPIAEIPQGGSVDRRGRAAALSRRLFRPVQLLRAVPNLGTWTGVLLAASGAALLVVAWVKTAALTNVGLQIPYVISAGFGGLALIVVGVTVISIVAKHHDSRERVRQVSDLRDLLAELSSIVHEMAPGSTSDESRRR